MKRLWLAIWFAVLGWDALSPHIEGPSGRLAAVGLVAAALLLLGRSGTRAWFGSWVAAVLAVVCGTSAILLPWPENLGPILLAAGFALAVVPVVAQYARGNPWRVPASLGALLTLLAGFSHVYRLLEAGKHDLDWLAHPIVLVYRILGLPAAADPPFVHIQGVGVLHTFDCSMEKFVGHALALFVAAGIAALAVLHGRALGWKRPLLLLLAAFGFAFVRMLALGLALDDSPNASNYYMRAWIFGGLLPFVMFLSAVFPPAPRAPLAASLEVLEFGWLRLPRAAAALVTSLLLGAFVAGALGFFDPGRPKPRGRVLIDEKHSNWEWSTIELTTESYGVQTVYNYSEMVRYLRYFYGVEANFESLTDSLLASTDVLVLKTPTRPYEDEEVEAIVRFVERGGGLWLIGDHTNVFGMSTNLNKVARRFGMRYRFDAAIDLLTYGRQFYRRPRLFAHPTIRHLPPILMATSSTMVGPPLGQPVMVGRSLLSDELDYSVNTFFGNFLPDPGEPFGCMLQSVAATRGKGRILAFSDSTIFSNFFMFIRGKPELALGSVAWLMRENQWAWVRQLLLGVAIAAAVLLAFLAPRLQRNAVLACLCVGLLGFAATARGLDTWVAGWSKRPEPNSRLPLVAFDRGKTSYHIPDLSEIPDRSPHSFHTFYVWTQRVGWIPTTRLFHKCLEGSEAVVLINPRDHFRPSELSALESYVRGGGELFVLDSPHARHSSANQVLQPFGMSFESTEMESVTVRDAASGDSLATLFHVSPVQGGEAAFLLPDGSSALSVAQVGEGHVAAMCASDNFSDATLGTTSQVPDEAQLALYQLQFRIFGDILGTSRRRASAAAP